MAITTVNGHCLKALAFFNNTNIYFGLGRQTEWNNPKVPDAPSITQTKIEEPLGFKKCESKYIVMPDENGAIIYREGRWSIVPANQAYDKGAKWVYVDCYINYEELPLGFYRQVGLLVDLVPNLDSVNKIALLPEQVQSQGVLFLVDNRTLTTRRINQKEHLSFIVEF